MNKSAKSSAGAAPVTGSHANGIHREPKNMIFEEKSLFIGKMAYYTE